MSLRLIEVVVASEKIEQVVKLFEDIPVVHVWSSGTEAPEGLVRVLLEAKHSEAVSDAMAERFSDGDFRLVMLPVEATVPAVDREAADEDAAADTPESDQQGTGRISREELYQDLTDASALTLVYLVMVALSTVVAAVGLIRGDVAIVIGAMVIAPLLGPNVALSLAATLGDPKLARRALAATGVGLATAFLLSCLVGAVFGVDPSWPELEARTRADLTDVILALAAGAAGSLAFTTGVPGAVVGVMVAVALLPPLVAAGLLAGDGYQYLASRALLLVFTNVICINLAAIGTFVVQRVRPRTWWEAERARKATWLAIAIWVAMLAVLVVLIVVGQVETP